MKHFVIENRNIGTIGSPKFSETILFTGTEKQCLDYAERKRKEYKDRIMVDCFVQSEEEINEAEKFKEFWYRLSPEEKKETIVVNGKRYFKAAYEYSNNKER